MRVCVCVSECVSAGRIVCVERMPNDINSKKLL